MTANDIIERNAKCARYLLNAGAEIENLLMEKGPLVAEKQYALDLLHAAETEMARLARCINMAMGCLDPHSLNSDERLAWYRLHDAQCGVEPRADLGDLK